MTVSDKLKHIIILLISAAAALAVCFAALQITAEASGVTYHENEKEAVAELREAMKQRKNKVTIGIKGEPDEKKLKRSIGGLIKKASEHTGEPDEGDYIAYQFASYKGVAHTTYSGSTPVYEIEYDLEYYDDAEQEEEVSKKAAEILAELDLSDRTDYEKIRAIHDYLCKNIEYEPVEVGGSIRYTAYGALIEGKAVCQGYSVSLYRLLLEAGISNRIIYGTGSSAFTEGGPHTWNIVELDGEYYYMDVTWDDSTGSHDYFLIPEGEGFEEEHIAGDGFDEDFFTEDYPVSDEEVEMHIKWVPDIFERIIEAVLDLFTGKNGG